VKQEYNTKVFPMHTPSILHDVQCLVSGNPGNSNVIHPQHSCHGFRMDGGLGVHWMLDDYSSTAAYPNPTHFDFNSFDI
jgi:hypothetical protein